MTPPFTCPVRDPSPAGSSRDNTDLQHTLPLLSSPEKLQHADHHLDAVAWQLGVKACQVCHPRDLLHPTPKAIPQCPATALGTAISIGRTFVVLHNSTK